MGSGGPAAVPERGGRGWGRPLKHARREIVNAIFYQARTGCSWRQLPGDLPPWATVYDYFAAWNADGTVDRIHDRLRAAVRDAAVRRWPRPGAWTPSRSRGADTVGAGSRGYDAGKKINGRKRHIVVDTLGLLMVVLVTAASVQDRDGGRRVLARAKTAMPSVVLVFADGGYAGRLVTWAQQIPRIVLEIVRKPEGQRGFAVLPRRWVVERTLSWLTTHRRLARHYERLPEHAEAWVKWSMIGVMVRRLAPTPGRISWT